jgi:hypothetical protein
MPAFDDIAAADYEETSENLIAWLDACQNDASEDDVTLQNTEESHSSTLPHTADQGEPDAAAANVDDPVIQALSPMQDLRAHCLYISHLHTNLVISEDPLKKAQCIETLAAALLEFSIPEIWAKINQMGEGDARSLVFIIHDVSTNVLQHYLDIDERPLVVG